MSSHSYTTKNKRDYQEDRYVIHKSVSIDKNKQSKPESLNKNTEYPLLDNHDITVLAIFDGHGGPHISQDVSTILPPYFYKVLLDQDNVPRPTKMYNKYIVSVFNMIQNHLSSKVAASTSEGTTACILLLYKYKEKDYITAINVGDSRAIACKQTLISQGLTKDHKPDNIVEELRIIKNGGSVTHPDSGSSSVARVDGVLAVARSLGDFDTKKSIEYKPDVFHYVNDYKFVIVASDGLWDVMNSDLACDFVMREIMTNIESIKLTKTTRDTVDNIAKKLANKATEMGSEDNISIIIYFFETNDHAYTKYLEANNYTNI